MGDRKETGDHCPRCGAVRRGRCPACEGGRPGPLVALPPAADGSEPPPRVPLVREIKGLTVRELVTAPPKVLDRLPAEIRAMARAVTTGELAEADARLDRTVGNLLRGPGYRRRRRLLRWLLVIAVPALAAAVLWWW